MSQKGQQKAAVLSRAKLGEQIFMKTNEFLLTDPNMYITRPTYNSLHDPHLRKFYSRKEMQDKLRAGGFITEEKEVKCSFLEYKTHHRYLEHLKLHTDRSSEKIQGARMREFLEQQQKGLISKDLTLADIREEMLEEGAALLHRIILKNEELRRTKKGSREEFSVEALLSWKLEERARLQRIERDVRHKWNKEQQLREAREKRERQRQALMARKNTLRQMKLIEEVKRSEESALKERAKKQERTVTTVGRRESARAQSTDRAAAPGLRNARVGGGVVQKQRTYTQGSLAERNKQDPTAGQRNNELGLKVKEHKRKRSKLH